MIVIPFFMCFEVNLDQLKHLQQLITFSDLQVALLAAHKNPKRIEEPQTICGHYIHKL